MFPRTAFVIMPFSTTASCTEAQWNETYEHMFVPAFALCGYACERAKPATGSLPKSLIEKLRTAGIVLADVTDRNANVFYELGIRHTLSNRTVIVARESSHVPSDLLGYWVLRYGSGPAEVDGFKSDIRRLVTAIESDPEKPDNPVSDYLTAEHISVTRATNVENVKRLGALYTELTGNLATLRSARSADGVVALDLVDDSIRLLLQTHYIAPSTEWLQRVYELHMKIRRVRVGRNERPALEALTEELELAMDEVLKLRSTLIGGEYEEPAAVALVHWEYQTDARDGDFDRKCKPAPWSAVRDVNASARRHDTAKRLLSSFTDQNACVIQTMDEERLYGVCNFGLNDRSGNVTFAEPRATIASLLSRLVDGYGLARIVCADEMIRSQLLASAGGARLAPLCQVASAFTSPGRS